MKSITLLLTYLLFTSLSFSQEKAIKITKSESQKEIILKENRRIRIRIITGEKISGKFKILNGNSIMIKDKTVQLSDIQSIKRTPLIVSIATDVFLIYYGVTIFGAGLLIYALTESPIALMLTIPATSMVYAGLKSPKILRSFKVAKNWNYEIVTINKK